MPSSLFSGNELDAFVKRGSPDHSRGAALRVESSASPRNHKQPHSLPKSDEAGAERFQGRRPEDVVPEIRTRRANGEKSGPLALEYGIDQQMVCSICLGKLFPDLGGPITRRRRYGGTLPDRIRSQAIVHPDPDACYGWTGRKDDDGYPLVSFGGKQLPAHRCVLQLKLGREIHPSEVTRHTCTGHRDCTNERHLIPGTIADNNRDKYAQGTQPFGEDVPNAKLTENGVRTLRAQAKRGRVNYEAAGRQHGVTGKAIKKAILGRTWTRVNAEALS